MLTPEGKVKVQVKKILDRYPSRYRFAPATGGFGSSGIPDIVACIHGKFIAVECKAKGNKPTGLQMKNLRDIEAAGGYPYIVDETGVGVFAMSLAEVFANPLHNPPKLRNFTAGATGHADPDPSEAEPRSS